MTETQSKKKGTYARFWLRVFGVLLLICALLLVLAWGNRKNLAEDYMTKWCVQQNVQCSGKFTRLSLDQVRLEGFVVQNGPETPFEVERVDLALSWPAFLSVDIASVQARSPILRGAIIDGEPGLYGLERLFLGQSQSGDRGGEASTMPLLDIQGGALVLATDAGELSGTFEVNGKPLASGTANLHINPSVLKQGSAEIAWSKGNIALVFQEGAVLGDIEFAVEAARLDGLGLSDGRFTAKLAEQGEQIAFDVSGNADALFATGVRGENVSIEASGGLVRFQSFDATTFLKALGAVTMMVKGENISSGEISMAFAELNVDMQQTNTGLSGPIAADIIGLSLPQGRVGELVATGEMAIGKMDSPAYRYKGSLVLRDAGVSAPEMASLLSVIEVPEPFDAHGAQLRRSISQGLAKFNVGLDVDTTYRKDNWELIASRPTLLTAQSGLILSIDPFVNQDWLKANQNGVRVSGDISLVGGPSTLKLDGALDELSVRDAGLDIRVRSMTLAPWQAAGRTISSRMESLELGLGERARMIANGEVGLSGAMPGLDLQPTRLIGRIRAVQAEEGWRVQTHNNSCVGFSSEGVGAGALQFASMALSLCPVDGRFVRQEGGQSVGRIHLGDMRLPFVTEDARGAFRIDDARLEWLAGDGFRLFVKGQNFDLPLQFRDDTLVIEGERPELAFALDGGPASIKVGLGLTEFSGSMVPANVTADAFSFDGVTSQTGVDGSMQAAHVRITDFREDPIYQPLIAELHATMNNGIVVMSGPIRSEAKGIVIASTDLNLHLADFSGQAQVNMVPLSFAIDGLQPVDLSEQLRGVLINVRGGMSGGADFLIQNGGLSGKGYVDLFDLIFDTLKAGTVSGVNGRIGFADILALTSHPNQKLTIDFMDPGVPLSDGEVTFQIVEGTTTKLEGARWPFANGTLEIMPTTFEAGAITERITVQASELELEKLLEVFKVPDLYASGTVSGDFPIDIEGANIMVRQAALTADEKGGWLSYAGDVTEVAQGQNEYADYAFEALKDFDFKVMRIVADGNLIGRILLTLDLLGKSDEVLGGAEFDFGISIDSNLSQLLRTGSETTSKTYLEEAYELKRRQIITVEEDE